MRGAWCHTLVLSRANAPREAVHRALLVAEALARWTVPAGMVGHVHEIDAREGGSLRISLTYYEPTKPGKTAARTDTCHGHFQRLVPNEQVVEVFELETTDPELRGVTTTMMNLADVDGGTDVVAHGGIPGGVSTVDNETGTRMALANLPALVEASSP